MTIRSTFRLVHPVWAAFLILFLLPGCGDDQANGTAGQGAANGSQAAAQTPPTDEPRDAQEPEVVNLADLGFNEGEEGPDRLYIIEFSDFGCIHCAGFHQNSYGALHDEFVEGDMAVWKYVPIAIGGFPNGPEAAMAAMCAGELNDFAAMRDHLYDRQREWSQQEQSPSIFLDYADDLGFDTDAFQACIVGDEVRDRLTLYNRVAIEIGVTATPTFLVQGQPVQGAPPLDAFQEVLRDMVAELRTP